MVAVKAVDMCSDAPQPTAIVLCNWAVLTQSHTTTPNGWSWGVNYGSAAVSLNNSANAVFGYRRH